jgi:clan AA aspartic protease (TIGR02281 family)
MKKKFNLRGIASTGWLWVALLCCFALPVEAQQADYSECNELYKKGEYVDAVRCYNAIIEKNPKDVYALWCRAYVYLTLEQDKYALQDISEAIKLHDKKKSKNVPKDALFLFRAKMYERSEEYDEALKDYAAALKVNSKSKDVFYERAGLYYTLEKYKDSDDDWNQVLNIDKENSGAKVGLARNMIAREELDNAIKELDKLEKKDYRYPQIYKFRGQAYSKKGDYRKAIDDAVNYIYYDDWESDYVALPLRIYAEKNYTYALAKVSEQVQKATDNKISWLALRAVIYEKQERYSDALADYNAIEGLLSSPNPALFEDRGTCYSQLGEYDKAIADFDEGLKLKESISLYLAKAEAERLKGDYKTAIRDFTKAIELDPMNNYAYYKRGWTKEFDNDFQGALKDYTTSIEIDNEYAYVYMNRGRLYQKELDKPELAKQDFEKVLELDTIIERSGNCRQYALMHLKRNVEAIAYLDSILTKYPSSGNYYDGACLYSLMNRANDAINHLRTAFEKGYRDFIHLEHDTDVDNIRNNPDFIKLLSEWKNKVKETSLNVNTSATEQSKTKKYVVKSKELRSGVYEIPCSVNDLPLKFIFDTGASAITISALDAAFMLKNNHLNEYDFRDRQYYRTASGELVEGTKVRLRKIKIGELELNNIEASVVHKQNAPLLFGQSALGKFVKITIDNKRSEITFEK